MGARLTTPTLQRPLRPGRTSVKASVPGRSSNRAGRGSDAVVRLVVIHVTVDEVDSARSEPDPASVNSGEVSRDRDAGERHGGGAPGVHPDASAVVRGNVIADI